MTLLAAFGQSSDRKEAKQPEEPGEREQGTVVVGMMGEPVLRAEVVEDQREVPARADLAEEPAYAARLDVAAQHREPDGLRDLDRGADEKEAHERDEDAGCALCSRIAGEDRKEEQRHTEGEGGHLAQYQDAPLRYAGDGAQHP
jgi:hypothetical protein